MLVHISVQLELGREQLHILDDQQHKLLETPDLQPLKDIYDLVLDTARCSFHASIEIISKVHSQNLCQEHKI